MIKQFSVQILKLGWPSYFGQKCILTMARVVLGLWSNVVVWSSNSHLHSAGGDLYFRLPIPIYCSPLFSGNLAMTNHHKSSQYFKTLWKVKSLSKSWTDSKTVWIIMVLMVVHIVNHNGAPPWIISNPIPRLTVNFFSYVLCFDHTLSPKNFLGILWQGYEDKV